MTFEYQPPKYAQVIIALQERITAGEYPPGSALPSEHQLSAEFATTRATVVRALRVLRQGGWIETQQGKGSTVRGRPALDAVSGERRGQAELDRDESRGDGELVSAGLAAATVLAAGLLQVEAGAELARRVWLVRQDGEPSELVTWWLSPALAGKTGLDQAEPVRGSVRALVDRAADARIDHVVERVAARHPEGRETKLLGLARSAPVLAVSVSARDATGRPVLGLEVAMAGDLHELEDAYLVG